MGEICGSALQKSVDSGFSDGIYAAQKYADVALQ